MKFTPIIPTAWEPKNISWIITTQSSYAEPKMHDLSLGFLLATSTSWLLSQDSKLCLFLHRAEEARKSTQNRTITFFGIKQNLKISDGSLYI